MTPLGWAIVGPGSIAGRFADTVSRLPETRLAAVLGRDAARARAFTQRFPDADSVHLHTDIASLLADPAVDAVYIATPHGFHAEAIRACLRARKPVLCEKPMTVDAATARELAALAQAQGVFLMEALWTRYLPAYAQVGRWLRAGEIGALRGLQSSFAFDTVYDPASRLYDPAQGGGALLDIGVYNLSMTQWALATAFGECPRLESVAATGVLAPTGVDLRVAASLQFEGGVVSQVFCAFDCQSDRGLRLFGERGVITLPERFWEATTATLRHGLAPPQVVEAGFEINGFEGQVREATTAIRAGRTQSDVVPLADTVQVLEWIDRIRAACGFPPLSHG
jgi:predicted dehydrogenase